MESFFNGNILNQNIEEISFVFKSVSLQKQTMIIMNFKLGENGQLALNIDLFYIFGSVSNNCPAQLF